MIRAFRTPTTTANRTPLFQALLLKCRIQVNRSCGSTTVHSPSPMKKRRSSRNMPKNNRLTHQPLVKGNVESNDLHLRTSLRDLTMLICMLAITLAFLLVVFFHRTSHDPITRNLICPIIRSLSVSIFFRMFPPQQGIIPYSTVFSVLHCWLPSLFCTYIIDAPSTVLSLFLSHLFPSYLASPGCFRLLHVRTC